MWNMVFLVLDDISKLDEVLEVWEASGVRGATILESTGLARRRGYLRDDVPLFPSISTVMQSNKEEHVSIFSLVPAEHDVEKLLARTETVTGDLSNPGTGVFFVVPLSFVKGVKD